MRCVETSSGEPFSRERSNITPSGPIAAIMLAGKTGSGKSSFIKLLGGRDSNGQEPISDGGLESCTPKHTIYTTRLNNRKIILLDTPGFDDSAVDNLTVLNDIVSNLHMFALQREEINTQGVIFLHDISETRFGGSQKKTLELLKNLCGEKSMQNVIIGTTMWSPENSKKFGKEVKRECDFLDKHWNGIFKTVRVPDEDEEVALDMVSDLLERPPTTLLVQEEMLKPPHTCENTTVGRIAIPEGRLEVERLKRELEQERKKAVEDIKAQEEKHKMQQELDRAFFNEERIKLEESARRLEEKKAKLKEEELELQIQNLRRISEMAAEDRKTALEVERQRIERENKRDEETNLKIAEMHSRNDELRVQMENREADLKKEMAKEHKFYTDKVDAMQRELGKLNDKLNDALEAARKKAMGYWEKLVLWFNGVSEEGKGKGKGKGKESV